MKKLSIDREKELFGPEATVITKYEKTGGGGYKKQRHTVYDENPIKKVREIVGMAPVKITIRNCLGCAEKFESEGSGNRMCDSCANYSGMI